MRLGFGYGELHACPAVIHDMPACTFENAHDNPAASKVARSLVPRIALSRTTPPRGHSVWVKARADTLHGYAGCGSLSDCGSTEPIPLPILVNVAFANESPGLLSTCVVMRAPLASV